MRRRPVATADCDRNAAPRQTLSVFPTRLIAGRAADNDVGRGRRPAGRSERDKRLDAIEQAIRNAFAKGDPEDPAFREKVYRWAYSVVDKAIQAKANLSPEDAERQRRRALAAIEKVESEFQLAEPEVAPVSREPATRSPEPDNAAPVPEIDPRPASGSTAVGAAETGISAASAG